MDINTSALSYAVVVALRALFGLALLGLTIALIPRILRACVAFLAELLGPKPPDSDGI